jgi:hypothetical protein
MGPLPGQRLGLMRTIILSATYSAAESGLASAVHFACMLLRKVLHSGFPLEPGLHKGHRNSKMSLRGILTFPIHHMRHVLRLSSAVWLSRHPAVNSFVVYPSMTYF